VKAAATSPSTRSAPALALSASAWLARPISPTLPAPSSDSEVESCQAIGRTPVEFRVGTDALAVVVSTENDFLTEITLAELALAFSTAETWADIRPEWPAETILRYSPGTDSGTFDFFVEAVMDPAYVLSDADEGKGKEAILNASNTQFSEDDNVLVQGVEGALRHRLLRLRLLQREPGPLKALSVEGVAPTAETAEEALTPLSPAVHLLRCGDHAEQTPGGGFHQLLPDLRQR
jgi:phosphate transport system substrate-binding protein